MGDDSRRSIVELEARLAELSHLANDARVQGVEPPAELEHEAQDIRRALDAERNATRNLSTGSVAFVLEPVAASVDNRRDDVSFEVAVGRQYVIGRDPRCDFHIPDRVAPLSVRHARLYWEGDRHLFIEGLGSVLGVIVNGERVRTRRLAEGDRIVLGARTFVVRARRGDSASALPDGGGLKAKPGVTQARLADVLVSVADPNGAAVVMLDGADIWIDVPGEKPWEDVIAEQTRAHGLAYVREGNLFVVGTKKRLDARPKPPTYTGPRVNIELREADPAAAFGAISLAAEVPYVMGVAPRQRLSIKLRHLPADQSVAALLESTGGELDSAAAMPSLREGCALSSVRSTDIRLAGTVIAGIRERYAVITDGGSRWDVVKVWGYIGSDAKCVVTLGPGRIRVGNSDDRIDQCRELRVTPATP